MKQNKTHRVVLLSIACLLKPLTTYSDVINVAGSGWCPYICIDSSNHSGFAKNPGFFTEIVTRIFAHHGHSIHLTIVPWSRAILETRQGKYNAAFGSSKSITPDFIFPETPQSLYTMCFHTRYGSTWKYTGVASLESIRLGIVQDYPYDGGGSVDEYIKQNINSYFVQVLKGEDQEALLRNIQKLVSKRIDAIIDNPYVINYMLQKNQLQHKLKLAGCLKVGGMYIAFSPALPISHIYADMITKGMMTLRKTGELKKILAKYGVNHWDITNKIPQYPVD